MKWLRNWFGVRAQAKPTPRPRIVPQLEALEKREVLTVAYNGGALLPHVEVQGLYYGSNWSTNSALFQQTGQFEGYLQYLVNSPYMDMLNKAGYNVGRGSYTAGQIQLANLNSANYLDDSTIRSNIQADVSSGALQAADANRLFVVFVEPNIAVRMSDGSNSQANFAGYHGAFTLSNGSTAHYAVIMTPGGTVGNGSANPSLGAFDEMTMAASHEIAEAVTDPNVNYSTLGWYDSQKNGEIGDITNGQPVRLNGYTVQVMPDKNDNPIFPTELSVTGETFNAVAGQTFSGRVGVGHDSVGLTHGSNLRATINWGDGTVTQGVVTDDGQGDFFVSGTHAYGQGGNFAVSVSLQDVTNSIGSASETTTESVQGAAGGQGTFEVGEFSGQGVWRHSASGWQQLTAANASRVSVDSHGDVVAEFQGQGVWRYEDGTGWQHLSGADASQVFITGNGIVVGEFQGQGIWRFEDGAGWQHLTAADASQVAVAGNGIVAAEFQGQGVWRFEDSTGWQHLTAADASQVVVDANGDVAAEFQGQGVWRFENGTGWQHLTAADAAHISIAGNGIVAAEFQGQGVWRFEDNGGWQHLTAADAAQIAVDAQGDVAGDYQGQGIWVFEQSGGWQHITAADALFMSMSS